MRAAPAIALASVAAIGAAFGDESGVGDETGLGVDPSVCRARHGETVDNADWARFASQLRPPAADGAVETYIERAAAICIARAAELGEGDVPWSARLLYLADERRVVWIITRSRRAASGGSVHRELVVDAVSGRALRASSYATRR